MLSSYYFLGIGNQYEGYPLLSAANLTSALFVSTKGYISNSQQRIDNLTEYSKNYLFEIPSGTIISSDISSSYVNINSNYCKPFYWSAIYCQKTNTDLFLVNNIIEDVERYVPINIDYDYRSIQNNLLVSGELISAELAVGYSNEISEYLNQLNLSLSGALSGNNWSSWSDKLIKFPTINDSSISSSISSIIQLDYNNQPISGQFIGLSSIVFPTITGYYKDIYILSGDNNYYSLGLDTIHQLQKFSFKEDKIYTLSGNYRYDQLYKVNDNLYIPLTNEHSTNSICSSMYIPFSALGEYTITNNYLKNGNSSYNTWYCFGQWIKNNDDLIYNNTFLSNIDCFDFKLVSGGFTSYPELIGVEDILGIRHFYHNHSIKNPNKNTTNIYISIDPASYSIAV